MKTTIQQLLERIPDGAEIKQAISENDMDEKMLDEWLWERIYKSIDWLSMESEHTQNQSIEFAKWLNKEGWEEYDESDRWICPSNNRSVYLTSKLYELFKKARQ